MKKYLLLMAGILFLSPLMANLPVNEKVLKAFNETFKDAKQVSWHETGNRYIVHFIRDNIRHNVTYDREGKMLSTKRYYFEDRLPVQIVLKVKEQFSGRSITGVTEILDENGLTYTVSLEDEKSLWTVKLNNEDVISVKKWKKN